MKNIASDSVLLEVQTIVPKDFLTVSGSAPVTIGRNVKE